MLKSRNSFFQESSMNSQIIQNPSPMPFSQGFYPDAQVQAQSASNSFYQGPIGNGYSNQMSNPSGNTTYNTYNNVNDDFENRLAKIERAINRLDSRITKLENKSQITTDDLNNSMYMV